MRVLRTHLNLCCMLLCKRLFEWIIEDSKILTERQSCTQIPRKVEKRVHVRTLNQLPSPQTVFAPVRHF
jgi:hypothetical protein